MIVDTSAIVAILAAEPERDSMLTALADATVAGMSAGNYLECAIVVDRRGNPTPSQRLDPLLESLGIDILPVDAEQARLARVAYRRFGRGSGHRAQLNLGDCFAYALASSSNRPLLFKGDDFTHTDIAPALT